ncbi:DNA alkylation repair protein [Cellulosimicrobium protaetiae]|uniref:DNA alkylation repair protein n=1 Tax=Cellulosimicrobium protaetiae TaxID=2587808 RepID=A0A6M5UDI6_9MICO|nr:DNA alkylation repair protein [Cellulosimicrobium protaetiae]QJW35275.1 DNA alkylation repair protein [Cellulosimicrobium protaetiae]
MPPYTTATDFRADLLARATAAQRRAYTRYFPGDDTLAGVRMGDVFTLAKSALEMPVDQIELLLEDRVHEVRAGGCSIMGKSATARRVTVERHAELVELFLRRHDRIDTWDLVDLTAYQVLGSWLLDRPRDVLDDLARAPDWPRRRSAIVATAAFLRRGQVDDTFRLSEVLVDDPEHYVQKGVGWMLRHAGDVEPERLRAFLEEHAATMPRDVLRAAVEKLPPAERKEWLAR